MSDYRAIRPQSLSVVQRLYTLQDAIDHVLLAFNLKSNGHHGRWARQAVFESYRTFPNESDWSYYRRRQSLATEAAITDGTISYDAGTRAVTLSGATWPADARFKWIIFNNRPGRVESRDSGTQLTLSAGQCPAEDAAAGTSYSLYRSVYPLPILFRSMGSLVALNECAQPTYLPPSQMLSMQVANYSPQDPPHYYTIRQSEDYLGGMSIEFAPPPASVREYDLYFRSSPQPFVMFSSSAEYAVGTVGSSSTTITGTGTAFTQNMVGCILRVSSAGTLPTGLAGGVDGDNPYEEQRVVQSVESGTSLTIDQAFAGTYSGAKYTIGSPLDVEPDSMLTAFLHHCEYVFSRLIKETEASERRYRKYINELRNARGADNRNTDPAALRMFYPTRLDDIRSRV